MVDFPKQSAVSTADPWMPISSVSEDQPVTLLMMKPDRFEPSLESERYLAIIESKLDRLKGRDSKKQPVAKDIINGLDKIRLSHMQMLTDIDWSSPYIRNTDYVDESASPSSIVDLVKRKIAPEKQAINEEELKKLVENDELLLTSSMAEQTESVCASDTTDNSQSDKKRTSVVGEDA